MLQNAYFLAKIGADTAENEQHFAEILPIGRRVADRCPGPRAFRLTEHCRRENAAVRIARDGRGQFHCRMREKVPHENF